MKCKSGAQSGDLADSDDMDAVNARNAANADLAHCVSVLGRYVHNPSQKHLDAYLRVAR